MIHRLVPSSVLLAALALGASADASQLHVSFRGGAWQFKAADQVEVWANSPQASMAVDNRRGTSFTSLTATWQNLMAGSYVATPEGVVIASSRDGSPMSSHLTVPPGERQTWGLTPNVNGPYRFTVIGDTRNPESGARVFGDLSRQMASAEPAFAVHLGNAVTGGNAGQMAIFRNQLKSFSFPTYVVPGNQDLTSGGRNPWKQLFGDDPISFKIDRDRFLLVDNAFGTLRRSERAWLERSLQQATDEKARHVFVFLHQPLVDPRPGINLAMRDVREVRQLLALFQRHGVHTVFAGHIPMYAKERRRDVDYITTGGGGEKLAVPVNRGGFHHFVKVEVNGEQVEVSPVPLK